MEPTVKDQLASMEQRLARIEKHLNLSAPLTPKDQFEPGPWTQPSAEALRYLAPQAEHKPGNWLGIIAVVCFVLAAGFIVKLSIESGWLTPERQIGLAALLGLGLIGAGLALLQSDRAYASLLPGAGIIILYATSFGAHRYYGLISFELAIALTQIISCLCIWLYIQIRHDAYAMTAAVGAYIAPAMLSLETEAVFSLYYFLLCSVTFAIISIWVKSRVLTLVSSYLAILMTGFAALGMHEDGLVASLLGLHFLVFAIGSYLYTIQNRTPLTERESHSFLPVLLLFYAVEYHLIDGIYPLLAPWLSLGFAGVLIALYVSARNYFPDGLGSQTLILAFATLAVFHSVYLELLPENFSSWLFVLIILGFAFAPVRLLQTEHSNAWRIPIFALMAILVIEYLTMLSHLWNDSSAVWLIVSLASFASMWAALVFAQDKLAQQPTYGHGLLGAAHILAVLALYRLTHDVGSLAVSAAWLFYGAGVVAFAFGRKDEVIAKSALFVLAFAAGKALLYDAASAPTIVRIFCLLLTGAVLYGCGLFMRRISSWKATSGN